MKKLLVISGVAVLAAALAGADAYGSVSTARKASLTIMHVQKGCHVFARGATRKAKLTVTIARGGSVAITNMDTDGHKVLQTRGPIKFKARALKMNDRAVFTFKRAGTYRFTTKTFELAGMPEMKTIGPDNTLRLTVVVK